MPTLKVAGAQEAQLIVALCCMYKILPPMFEYKTHIPTVLRLINRPTQITIKGVLTE